MQRWHLKPDAAHRLEFLREVGEVNFMFVSSNRRMPDQPYNLAVISLDEDPSINFYSNLPGTQPYKAVIGSKVSLIFEQVSDDQLIPEWIVS